MDLSDYVTLGRTGLRVSPLCLGTMTFGADSGRGADPATSRHLLDIYTGAGGNFIDTADVYTRGRSEELLGEFLDARGIRDQIVIATKFSFNTQPGNPNAGGNGRKTIYRALESSLRRLKTDYVDLYYLHAWDTVTPAEEVLSTLTDLVRSGKIRYFGISDAPAWYISRMQTMAEGEGKERVAAIQHEYSLVERTIEREHIPAAQHLGIGVCAWGPLSGGLLTGKYQQSAADAVPQGRLRDSPQIWNRFTERNLAILATLLEVSAKLGEAPARVALNWVTTQSGVTSTLVGATKTSQLDESLAALRILIPSELRARLDEIGVPEPAHPYKIFGPTMQSLLSGGTSLRAWRAAYPYADLLGNGGSPIRQPNDEK